MEARHGLTALNMTIVQLPADVKEIIHHSDRGAQHCCKNYVKRLIKSGIAISMTENVDPYENAIAERVNGILKSECLYTTSIPTVTEAKKVVNRIVKVYNTMRPHLSIDKLTPKQAHQEVGLLKRLWKSYYKHKKKEIVET